MTEDYRQLHHWLEEGILAAKAGEADRARFLLLDVVEQDQTNEAAWFWLYKVFDRPEDKQVCLENLIIINPNNQWARHELQNYPEPAPPLAAAPGQVPARSAGRSGRVTKIRPPRPVTLKLVTAFWFGISVILLVSGIMATGEWLVSGLRNRTIPDHITLFQGIELLVALLFLMAGIAGLNVAVALLVRSGIGFYGSLFLGLVLLLVGPTVSLIASPPNYIALVCTGGIAGMIVLLTLASQPGFKDSYHDDNASG